MTVTSQLGGEWNLTHMVIAFLGSGAVWSWAANAVDTFPVPENKYWRWVLGCIQKAIGQKDRASNTIANKDSIVIAVPKKPNGNGTP